MFEKVQPIKYRILAGKEQLAPMLTGKRNSEGSPTSEKLDCASLSRMDSVVRHPKTVNMHMVRLNFEN